MPFKVAIVGRPNVGKSSLFNRIVGSRQAITDEQAGVTRDRIYGNATWLSKKFSVIDTGGIDIGDAPFLIQIKEQANIAIDEADLILFTVDGNSGLTDNDMMIAKILYKQDKKVLLVVNKIDDLSKMDNIYDFYALGFLDVFAISTVHGIGMGDLLDKIIEHIDDTSNVVYEDRIPFCIVGRPNVGKSSLTNAILGTSRVIVSPIAGTTMDSIDTSFRRNKKDYVVIDTAGIRKKGKIYENSEKYALLRVGDAIERSDVALLVLDGSEGVIEADKHVASYITIASRAVVIVVNKWDIVTKDERTMKKMETTIKEEFKFLDFAEIVFVSALENTRIDTVFKAIDKAHENYQKKIQTSILNEVLADAIMANPPAVFNHGKFKLFYAAQVAINPPAFALFVNNPEFIHFSYQRYLNNKIRESFDLVGTPIKLLLRKKE